MLELIDRRFLAAGQAEVATPKQEDQAKPADIELGLDPEIYDDGLVEQFRGLIGYVNRLEQRLEKIVGSARSQRMDSFFAGLGDEYADMFGKQPLDALPSSSPQRKLRTEVESTMDVLEKGYRNTGQPVPGEQILQERALRLVVGDRVQELARKKVEKAARDARGQFIAKPTHREGKPLSRSERAAQYAEQFYKRKGM